MDISLPSSKTRGSNKTSRNASSKTREPEKIVMKILVIQSSRNRGNASSYPIKLEGVKFINKTSINASSNLVKLEGVLYVRSIVKNTLHYY